MSKKITITPKFTDDCCMSFEISPEGDNDLPENVHKIIEPLMEFYTKERNDYYDYLKKKEDTKWFNSAFFVSIVFTASILYGMNLYFDYASSLSQTNTQFTK